MPDQSLHDDGPRGSVLQSEIRECGWHCNGYWFKTCEEATTYAKTLISGRDYFPPQSQEEKEMTEKKPRRLRVRKRPAGVDQALIDKLVAQQLKVEITNLVADEKREIRKQAHEKGYERGHKDGHAEGYKKGVVKGEDDAEHRFHARALQASEANERLSQFSVSVIDVAPGNPRYQGLNNGWGYLTPMELQSRANSHDDVYIHGCLPELHYDYRVDTRQRAFQLRIWKGYQNGSTKKFEIDCNFTEEAMQQESGAGALLNFLCTICVEGSKYMDAEQLCEYMADWVISTRARDTHGPTIRVPKSARPQALAKFRDAVGLTGGE